VIAAHPSTRLVSAFEVANVTTASASHGSAPRRRAEGSHAAASQTNVIGARRDLGSAGLNGNNRIWFVQ
jgi:hypothetical protein